MSYNTNADAKQARRNEWIECPKCRSVLLPLGEYEVSSSDFSAGATDLWEMLVWGWMPLAYNLVLGLLGFGGKKAALAKQKKSLLPAFPNSLICPRCLYVLRR